MSNNKYLPDPVIQSPKFYNKNISSNQYVTDETLLLTDSGYKTVKDIKVGDVIYDFQGKTHRISDIVSKEVIDEKLLKVNVDNGDNIIVSPDTLFVVYEPIFTAKGGNTSQSFGDDFPLTLPTITRAAQIIPWSWSYIPIPKRMVYDEPNRYDIAGYIPLDLSDKYRIDTNIIIKTNKSSKENPYSYSAIAEKCNCPIGVLQYFVESKITLNDELYKQLDNYLKTVSNLSVNEWHDKYYELNQNQTIQKRYITMSPNFAYLCGYYIADGCCRDNIIELFYNEEDTHYIQKTEQALEDITGLSLNCKHADNKRMITGFIHSVPLVQFFKEFMPGYAIDKAIPSDFLNADNDTVLALLEGLIDGDGSTKHQSHCVTYTSISRTLINQIKWYLLTLGIPSSVIKCDESKHSTFVNAQPSYKMQIPRNDVFDNLFYSHNQTENEERHRGKWTSSENYISMRITKIEPYQYSGNIYEIYTDDKDSSFVATSSGMVGAKYKKLTQAAINTANKSDNVKSEPSKLEQRVYSKVMLKDDIEDENVVAGQDVINVTENLSFETDDSIEDISKETKNIGNTDFVYGNKTSILTNRGYVNIANLKSGDVVYNYKGEKRIISSVDKKKTNDIFVSLSFTRGDTLECSSNCYVMLSNPVLNPSYKKDRNYLDDKPTEPYSCKNVENVELGSWNYIPCTNNESNNIDSTIDISQYIPKKDYKKYIVNDDTIVSHTRGRKTIRLL